MTNGHRAPLSRDQQATRKGPRVVDARALFAVSRVWLVAVDFVDFHEGDPGSAVGSGDNRCVATGFKANEDGCLSRVRRRDRTCQEIAYVGSALPVIVLGDESAILE